MEELIKDKANEEFLHTKTRIESQNKSNQIFEKDKTIENLTEHIQSLENNLKSICGDFLFECRDFKKVCDYDHT